MNKAATVGAIDLSFCWAFKETELERDLTRLKSHGFEGIEIWTNFLKQHGASTWARALSATGMKCFQLCPYFNFMGGEATMTVSRAILLEFLEAARELDCKRLRVFTGPPWGEGIVGPNEATPQQWEDAIAGLQEFCDRALPQGVELCLECHKGSLMEDTPSTLRLMKGVNRKNLTVNLQLPLWKEPWETSLRALAPYTTHIHIHNWTEALGKGDLTFLEAGAFDWKPVVQYLCVEEKRRVCLSVEHGTHNGKDDAWETARRDGPFLQKLRESIVGG